MNGFTGFIGETRNVALVLDEMMDKIRHRGPNSSGVFIENEAALGFLSLRNLDEEERQPHFNAKDSFVVAYDGQIYNSDELRGELISKGYVFETDKISELLIHGYIEYAEKLPEKLRGVFAFVIWDRKNKKTFGARDRFGVKPFYYAHMNDIFFFGSEIKSFLPHPDFVKELNEKALKPYLIFQFPVLNETFFKGVFKLKAAHYLTNDNGQISTERYWSPSFNPTDQPLEEIVGEIDDALRESISVHQKGDVKLGAFLSSGVDSSYVTTVLKPEKTFTVGFSKENFSEIDSAKKLSDELGIENVRKILDPTRCFDQLEEILYMMDEPHSNPSIIPMYFLAELASREVSVVLTGEGADELFGGYDEYDMTKMMKNYKKIPVSVRKSFGIFAKSLPEVRGKNFLIKCGLSPEEWFIGRAKVFEEKEVDNLLTNGFKHGPTVQDIVKPIYKKVENEDDITKMQYLDMHLWLVDDILLKADKMNMAHSLEIRSPFLDQEVMKVAEKVPSKYRVNNIDTKYALRLAAKRALPEEYANRKKIGFPVPIHHWIREEKYYLKIKASFESAEAARFFDKQSIMNLLSNHYQGKVKNGRKIWAIYMFLIWHKKYFIEETVRDDSKLAVALSI
ncbi:asparagine synthase (glutamine-hydrolyzing) [Sporosarcina sp. Marseille-Q4063]|uniref:asparagine synthase (glutamine-hydrolyzing) n=1 Tax=Sporosarcina sp. Marseille-Q4063 TaxID=2810514 RepID=UPI001BAF2E0B|nr:asparagine synthase (glutamine-hydrolyzing) [Sporosarcina sp. Marseille-Q4063]QUW23313.1 asparagine synthase (glutamine-hydrolyzing) [Sporosarcina sp. Marseille-Q4063]